MNTHDRPSLLRSCDLYDVIVVGAHASGAATAMLLSRQGLRTLLVDRGTQDVDDVAAHALMRGGVLQLRRWGLLDGIIAAGTPPVRRTTYRYGDEQIVITMKSSHGVDALYAPRQAVLDGLLVAAELAGARVQHRTTVTGLITHDGRVCGVHATTPAGEDVAIGARLVIGADGIHSTVARQVGAALVRSGDHAAATTFALWSNLETDGYELNFHANASSGVVPTSAGEACVFASGSPERIGRGGVAVIREIVAENSPGLAARLVRRSDPRGERTLTGEPGFIRRSYGCGWALVGDAGYFKDPISAHGLTDALRDAELLARAVVEGFDRGGATALDDALAEYQLVRDRLSIPLFDAVDRIAGHRWSTAEIAQLLLQLNSATASEVETLAALEMEEAS